MRITRRIIMKFDELKTPAYVIDEKKLIHNLEILKSVEEHTGCHILLAQKAFSFICVVSTYIAIHKRNNGKRDF